MCAFALGVEQLQGVVGALGVCGFPAWLSLGAPALAPGQRDGRSLAGEPQQDSEAGQGRGELAGQLADRGLSPGPSSTRLQLGSLRQGTAPLRAQPGICKMALAGCEMTVVACGPPE